MAPGLYNISALDIHARLHAARNSSFAGIDLKAAFNSISAGRQQYCSRNERVSARGNNEIKTGERV